LAEISHFLYLTRSIRAGKPEGRMRKRGKYGLNNITHTCKIGSFPTDFVGDLEWGFLKLPSSRDAAVAGESPGSCCNAPGAPGFP